MDSMSYRNNRPAPNRNEVTSQSTSVAAPATPSTSQKSSKRSAKPQRKLLIIATLVAVVIVALAAWFFISRSSTAGAIDGSKYQAVFFTNGQVYFGKLSQLNGEYMSLKNVYYLQSKSSTTDDKASPQSASKQN
jgi:hypothetical protein